jgi:hypothetical protein
MPQSQVKQSEESTLLSDKDVLRIIGPGSKVMTYPEVMKYGSIEALFGGYDKIILLYINEIDGRDISGHWCLLTKVSRNGKIVCEFSDPYGYKPDDQLKFYTPQWRTQSGQRTNHLTKLLYDFSLGKNNEVHYNELELQKDNANINTCGRIIGLRGHFYKIPLAQYQQMFRDMKRKGYDLDKVAVALSNELNGGSF